MKSPIYTLFIVFSIIFFTVSCATPPTDDMNRAEDAVIRAENNADAVNYASGTLTRARDALTRMQIEADAKRYDTARAYAAEAIAFAERAIEEGTIAAMRARDEAAAMLNGLSGSLTETTNALNNAGRDLDIDLPHLQAELDYARQTHNEARQDLAENNVQDAVSRGQVVRVTLSGINTAINEAAQLTLRKR